MTDTNATVLTPEERRSLLVRSNNPHIKQDRLEYLIEITEKAAIEAYQRQQWRPPETAPRDMTVFLGDFGYPWPMAVVWNPVSEQFCAAELQIDMYEGKYEDSYFQNEYLPAHELRRWMPLPDLPTAAVDNPLENPVTEL